MKELYKITYEAKRVDRGAFFPPCFIIPGPEAIQSNGLEADSEQMRERAHYTRHNL